MLWQQPQKQALHPTEFYGFWLQAVSSQMAESEVTDGGEEPAWCQRTTWSLKKKEKTHTAPGVSALRPEVKLGRGSMAVASSRGKASEREQNATGPKSGMRTPSTFHEVYF